MEYTFTKIIYRMIKPAELRLGNYIQNESGEVIKILSGITIDLINRNPEWYSGVPIDRKMLTQIFCDNMTPVAKDYFNERIIIRSFMNDDIACLRPKGAHKPRIKYIHDLQNHFFFNYKEELILELCKS